jgi:hypothetical protein
MADGTGDIDEQARGLAVANLHLGNLRGQPALD